MTNKHLSFDVSNAEIVEQEDNSQFITAKINAFSSGPTRNNTTCSPEALKECASTIYEKPILFTIDKSTMDFYTHVDPSKNLISGFVIPDSASFEENSGVINLNILAKIWRRYSENFINIFKQDNTKQKKVSVEVELVDAEDQPNGLLDMKKFIFDGICVLGDTVTEAVRGSNIQLMSFAEENIDYQKAVELEFGKYDDLDMSIPQSVKDNVKKGLDLYAKYGKGATSVALAAGRHLLKSDKSTPEKIRHISKTHKSNKFTNMKKSPPSDEYISYMIYGGAEAKEWAQGLSDKLDEVDNKHLSYFGLEVTMPYDKISDANPAIRDIDPPVSLGQANAIARQADAVGTDKEKNGWAIAISSFKKTHKVVNGHWVEKDKKMSEDDVDEDENFAKEENGKGEAIAVDKSKDSMSSTAWGSVDKTALMHKVLNASNYKSLVKDVYAQVDEGWEEHPSSSLHYPIMQISGGKAVYNRYGLASALQRAEGQNESGIVSKVKGIYNKMGLENPKKEAMSVKGKDELDKENMAKEESPEEEKTETPKKEKQEEDKEKKENPEEEKKEKPADEKKEEDKEKKMSLDNNLDVAFLMKLLEDQTEDEKAFVGAEFAKEEGERNYSAICMAMYTKMCKMAAEHEDMCGKMAKMAEETEKTKKDNEAYMQENMSLKEFKANVEKTQFSAKVEAVLADVIDIMPQTEIDKAREDSINYTMETVTGWENSVKAVAFSYSKGKKPKEEFMRIGLPFANTNYKQNDSPWPGSR